MAKRARKAENVVELQQQAKKLLKEEAKLGKSAKKKAHNTAAANDQRNDDQIRAGFNQHRQAWVQLTAKQKTLDKLWTDAKAALKADGYKVIQMQIADDLAGSPKQEAKVHVAVQDRLQVAKWIGHPLGAQLDLFAQPDRTPAVDRAYDLGKQAFMENQPAKPPYDSSTPQYAKWLEGHSDAQSAALKKGIKPLETEDPATPPGWGASRQRDPSRPLDA